MFLHLMLSYSSVHGNSLLFNNVLAWKVLVTPQKHYVYFSGTSAYAIRESILTFKTKLTHFTFCSLYTAGFGTLHTTDSV